MSRGVWGILGRIPTRKLIHKAPTVQILVVELAIKIVYHPLAVRLGALRRESDFELAVEATLKQKVNQGRDLPPGRLALTKLDLVRTEDLAKKLEVHEFSSLDRGAFVDLRCRSQPQGAPDRAQAISMQTTSNDTASSPGKFQLRRKLRLTHLILYGIVIVQPTAPMPIFGVVSQEARGHVVLPVLLAMIAMLLTATSYGRMARVYPSAGSAYTYVAAEFGNTVGYLTGWVILLDYLLNPIICTIWCSKAAGNFLPMIPIPLWSLSFALLFTMLNMRGIEASARTNYWLAGLMSAVVAGMLFCMCRYILHTGPHDAAFLTRPFYDPLTFSWNSIWQGTSVAALTYIGFDSISTLSEEAINPKRDILLATVLTCLVTGVLASAEVYAAQLVWPHSIPFPDIDTAYVFVAGRAGGKILFNVVNATLLIATMGSGIGTQLGAARLLYGMGRDNALPRRFFGAIDPKRGIPANNVLFIGVLALGGSLVMSYQLGAELLNFGAFLAFMGVNAATIVYYVVKGRDRRWSFLALPLGGFIVCLYTWANLRWTAKLAGAIWLTLGILYGIYRWRFAKAEMETVTKS